MTNIEEIYAAMSADELASFKAASAQHHDQSTPEFLAATKALVLLQDRLGHDHPEVLAEANRVWAMGPQGMRDFWADFHTKREKRAAEIELHRKQSTPEYRAAVAEAMRLVDLHGHDHPDTTEAICSAMRLAPETMQKWLSDKVEEMGLLPGAAGYDDNDQPVYRLGDIAQKLGISDAQAIAAAERVPGGLVHQSQVLSIQ